MVSCTVLTKCNKSTEPCSGVEQSRRSAMAPTKANLIGATVRWKWCREYCPCDWAGVRQKLSPTWSTYMIGLYNNSIMGNKEKPQRKPKLQPSDTCARDCSGEELNSTSSHTESHLRVSLILETLLFKWIAIKVVSTIFLPLLFLQRIYKKRQFQLCSLLHLPETVTSGRDYCNIIQPDHTRPAKSWSQWRKQLLV